jgi:hypothetical protein
MKKEISFRLDKRERTFAKWSIALLMGVLTIAYFITPSNVFGQPQCNWEGLTLSPLSETLAVGETHQLTAKYCSRGYFQEGIEVDFQITGPNSSSSGLATTDTNGTAYFNYEGNGEGVDTIIAIYFSFQSNEATATWTQKSEPPTVDIETGPTKLNVNSQGVLPMTVFGAEDFDVKSIDTSSLLLNGAVQPLRHEYEYAGSKSGEPDGFLDLTLKFDLQEIVKTLGDSPSDGDTVTLVLTGSLYNTETATQTAARTATTIKAVQDVVITNKVKRKGK